MYVVRSIEADRWWALETMSVIRTEGDKSFDTMTPKSRVCITTGKVRPLI